MASISRVRTWVTGDTLTAADLNAEFNNILNLVNGAIDNSNISASAAIAYSKLNLTGTILNADLAGSIAASKISNTAVTLSDTQTLTNKTLTAPTISSPVLTVGSDAQGDIYYRGASGFTRLGAGTSGQFLKTQGAGADPTWAASSSVAMYVNSSVGGLASSSGSLVDVTNGSVSVTLATTSDVFISVSGLESNSNNSVTHQLAVLRDATTVIPSMAHTYFTAGNPVMFSMSKVETSVGAGTYTYKVQQATSGGTFTTSQVYISVIVRS